MKIFYIHLPKKNKRPQKSPAFYPLGFADKIDSNWDMLMKPNLGGSVLDN